MDIVKTLLRRYLKAAWRRRWLGLALAWLVCVIGWGVIAMLPNQYTSAARIYVDTDAVLTPLLKGIAVDATSQDQVNVLQQTLVSRPHIDKLISKTDLDLQITGPASRDAMVSSLLKNISVGRDKGDPRGVFEISYTSPDPKLAQKLVDTLLTIFTEDASVGNRTQMETARAFLQHQIASYADQLQAADKRRAAFRNQYPDLFVGGGRDLTGDNAAQNPLDAVKTKVADLEGQLQTQKLMAAALQKQLSSPQGPAAASRGADPKLAEAEARLRVLRMRYTDSFPDVVAARQEIDALRASPSSAAAVARANAGNAQDQIQLKLAETNGQMASAQQQLAQLKQTEARLEKLQRDRPNLLVEYENLDRDYSGLQKSYADLVSRLQSANIGAAANTQANAVTVRQIDPPSLPVVPTSPNRLLLVSGVLLGGIAIGFGLPIMLSQLDQSFWVVEDLRSLGLPVVGGISLLAAGRTSHRIMAATGFGVAALLLVAIYGGLLFRILRATAVV